MASGKELRRRITSVRSTQQITKAMKMVSAAKLKRAQDAITQARPYALGIRKVVGELSQDASLSEESPLFAAREVKNVLVVLYTSDRGLCGGFNSNLNKRAFALAKEAQSKGEKLSFACIGKKGFEFLKIRGLDVHKNYANFLKTANFAKISVLGDELIESFLSGEFDEIRIVFAEFKSALSQVIRTQTILPIKAESNDEEAEATTGLADFTFEPSKAEILEKLLPRAVKISLHRAMLESAASEHGARMAAMDSATSNAGDVIKKLKLQYNNIRQAGITKELLEITSGAEAL